MKKFIAIAAIAALAACAEAEAPEVEPEVVADMETTAAEGLYEISIADGTVVGQTQLNADGTYTDMEEGKDPVSGTWEIVDGKTCFDPEGDDGATCFTDGDPAEDGSWVATGEDGESVTVTPVKDEAS